MRYSLPGTPAPDETRLQSPEPGLEAHQRREGAQAGPPPPTATLGQGSPGGPRVFCLHATQVSEVSGATWRGRGQSH